MLSQGSPAPGAELHQPLLASLFMEISICEKVNTKQLPANMTISKTGFALFIQMK